MINVTYLSGLGWRHFFSHCYERQFNNVFPPFRTAKNKMLSNFYQNFTSSLSMYMEFKSVKILVKSFFVLKIEQFYLVLDYFVLDFFDRIILFLIYAIFLQIKESKLCYSNPFEFFQYHFPFRK